MERNGGNFVKLLRICEKYREKRGRSTGAGERTEHPRSLWEKGKISSWGFLKRWCRWMDAEERGREDGRRSRQKRLIAAIETKFKCSVVSVCEGSRCRWTTRPNGWRKSRPAATYEYRLSGGGSGWCWQSSI